MPYSQRSALAAAHAERLYGFPVDHVEDDIPHVFGKCIERSSRDAIIARDGVGHDSVRIVDSLSLR